MITFILTLARTAHRKGCDWDPYCRTCDASDIAYYWASLLIDFVGTACAVVELTQRLNP